MKSGKVFKHFLITRFNVPLRISDIDNKYARGISDDYLKKRFEIFENYCLPSVNNQTNKNFTWIVLLSNRTPDFYKNKMSNYAKECKELYPCYIDLHDFDSSKQAYPDFLIQKVDSEYEIMKKSFPDYIPDEYEEIQRFCLPLFLDTLIKKLTPPRTEYVLTSRLDNDDGINCHFIEDIQSRFKNLEDECVLNYLYGYQYEPSSDILKKWYYTNNHFITLIQKFNNEFNDTILSWQHGRIFLYRKVINIVTKPMWVEYVHDSNVVNSLCFSFKDKLVHYVRNASEFGSSFPKKTSLRAELRCLFSKKYRYGFFDSLKKAIKRKIGF